MTPEEMQAKILELTEENQTLKQEKETLSGDNEKLKTDNDNLRTINQKYFNKLIAQEDDSKKKEDEEEGEKVPTCEEFAEELIKKGF